jgi:hypothetical protein
MLEEAKYGETEMALASGRNTGDETLLVRFYLKPWQNQAKSKLEGRPIFEELEHIEIRVPGNKSNIIMRPATDRDKNRFPEHYRKFKAREDQEAVEGTLLSEWPGVTRGQCEEMKFFNIRTVEQLANMADSNAHNVMGIQALKAKATRYLETSKESATAEKFAALEAKYEALLARFDGEAPEITMKGEGTVEAPTRRKRRTKAATE